MFARSSSSNPTPRPSRRTFVKGLAIGGAAASVGLLRQPAWAQSRQRQESAVLSGTEFDLRIGETEVNLTGAARTALTINDSLPGPAAALAGGRHDHPERLEQPRRGHVDSLARHPAARQHGRRARPQLLGHPSGPGVPLPVHGEAARHLLVPQPFRLPGAAGRLRAARDRAARARPGRVRPRARRHAHGLDGRAPGARLQEAEEAVGLLQLPPAHADHVHPRRAASTGSAPRWPSGGCGARCA